MIKVIIKYTTDEEKNKLINILSSGVRVKKIGKPFKSGQYYRIYLDIE